jgi:hypothetical protein
MDSKMLIKYRPEKDHIKCVALIPATEELKKIKLTRSQVPLLPGTNEVTDDEWEVMKAHLAREIERREIIPIEAPAKNRKAVPGGKAHNLKDVGAADAAALVADCVNPDTLRKWYREETRDEIRLAIVEKMKELKIEIPKFTAGEGIEDDGEKDEGGAGDGEDGGSSLDEMTVKELMAYAAERSIAVSGNKAEILAAIKEAEAR